MDTAVQKKLLRAEVRASERAMSREEKRRADETITQTVLSTEIYRSARTVFAFVGTDREIDTSALLCGILGSGKRLCVPLCTGDGLMQPKEIHSLSELAPGAYGIPEPSADCRSVAPEEIDLVIVPCVSCSHTGARLGQGGGFYDRFFEHYRGESILVCRERLTREDIPTEPHDARFRTVVTDSGLYTL